MLSIFPDRENTGNLRNLTKTQRKHEEFGQSRENEEFLGLSYGLAGGRGHLENKICSFLCVKKHGKRHGISHEVECGQPDCSINNGFQISVSVNVWM